MTYQPVGPGNFDAGSEPLGVHPRQLDYRNSPGGVGQDHHCRLPEVGPARNRRHALDRSEAPAEPVEIMHAHVQEQAARTAGIPVPLAYGAWRARNSLAFCQAWWADLARHNHFSDAGVSGEIAHYVTYRQFHPRLLARGQGVSRFGGRTAKRLFAKYVAPGLGRLRHQVCVGISGSGHHDGVGPAGADQPIQARTNREGLALAQLGHRGQPLGRGHPADLGAGQAQEGAQVYLRHEPTSHDTYPQRPAFIA